MWIYRRISRTPWTDKVTNQHVLQKINIKSTELVQMIRTRKAKFYGHVRRHDSLQRVILEGKVEGKRGRGRKRTSWTDNIKTHLGLPINTCADLALDRKKWRAMTPNVGSEKEPGWINLVEFSVWPRAPLRSSWDRLERQVERISARGLKGRSAIMHWELSEGLFSLPHRRLGQQRYKEWRLRFFYKVARRRNRHGWFRTCWNVNVQFWMRENCFRKMYRNPIGKTSRG